MKNTLKIFGIMAVFALIVCSTTFLNSCEIIKGGTITVVNNGNIDITVSINDPSGSVLFTNNIVEKNNRRSFTVEKDGKYKVISSVGTKNADIDNGNEAFVYFP